jgi:NAD(P)H-nitrite reductase large subunit
MDKEFLRQIDSLDELLPAEKLEDEILICECFCVSAGDIRKICSQEVDLQLLQVRFNLGQGCHSCLKNSDNWVNKIF